MITTICLSVAATALLVPFIKVTCEHYSASEKQKRADWKRSPPTLTPEAAIAAFVALPASLHPIAEKAIQIAVRGAALMSGILLLLITLGLLVWGCYLFISVLAVVALGASVLTGLMGVSAVLVGCGVYQPKN